MNELPSGTSAVAVGVGTLHGTCTDAFCSTLEVSEGVELRALCRQSVIKSDTRRAAHKRIRTSFKRIQLDTLRDCFKRTHKPSGNELCQLVHRTGLSRRVIQVSTSASLPIKCVDLLVLMSVPLHWHTPLGALSRFGFRINVPSGSDTCSTDPSVARL